MVDARQVAKSIRSYAEYYGIAYENRSIDMDSIDDKNRPEDFYDYKIAKIENGKAELMDLDFSKQEDLNFARGIAYSRRIQKACQSKNFLGEDRGPVFDAEFIEQMIPVLQIVKGYIQAAYYTQKIDVQAISTGVKNYHKYASKFVEHLFSSKANIKAIMEYYFKDENFKFGNIRIDTTSPNSEIVFDTIVYEVEKKEQKTL